MKAASNSTRTTSTARAPKGVTPAPEFIQAANPLSCDSIGDTIEAVNAVLGFLQNYVLCEAEQNVITFDSGGGMYHILQCCKSALDAHVVREGGAT